MKDTFERWEIEVRLALADRGMAYHEVTPFIETARADVRDSGREPRDVLGPPDEFAASVAADRPAAVRGAVDRTGMSAGDHLAGGLFVATVMVVGSTVFAACLDRRWSFAVTPAGAVGVVLTLVTLLVAQSLPAALRAAGRPRPARWSYPLAAVLAVAAAAAFTMLPRTSLVTVPVLVVVGVGAVALWWQLRPTPRRSPAGGEAEIGPDDAEAWLRRLQGLLEGRHGVPSARAAELVADAREHVRRSGASPSEEFGPVGAYAVLLAESLPRRHGAVPTGPTAMLLLAVASTIIFVRWGIGYRTDAHPVAAALCWLCAAAGAATAVRSLRALRQGRRRPASPVVGTGRPAEG